MGRKPSKTRRPISIENALQIAALVEQGAASSLVRRVHRRSGGGRDVISKAVLAEPEKFPLNLHLKILATLWPRLYDPPKKPTTPATVKSMPALVRLRAQRFRRGEVLWHVDDVIAIDCTTNMRRWNYLTQKDSAVERRRRMPRTGTVTDLDDDLRREMET